MGAILNPGLADAMEARFGYVRVINAGQELEGYYEPQVNPDGTSSVRLRIVRRGETHVSNCPFCNDARERLAVNHRFGVRDDQTGFRGTELWKCYNQECQSDPANRRQLWDWLYPLFPRRAFAIASPRVRTVQKGRLEPCEFPGLLVSLPDLPPDHPAVLYLLGRHFDPAELSVVWKVAYAQSVPARVRGANAQGRIICPVHLDGVMVGYQARYVGDIDWKATHVPKYLTYFPKSLTLYGIDEAAKSPLIALVEGVTDVWRYGPGAVSPLGKTLSVDQARLIASALGTRPLVLVPDADDPKALDAFCDNAVLVSREAGRPIPVGIAQIPPGSDPGSLSRPTLRRLVDRAAASVIMIPEPPGPG